MMNYEKEHNDTFFHFRWNSLGGGHVSIRAQEKKLHTTFSLLMKTHATPTPTQFKQNTPKKCQEKTFLGKENRKKLP